MRIIPSKDELLLEPVKQSEKTAGGVDIPQESQRLIDEAIIREIGSNIVGRRVGDRVIYSRYSGTWVKWHPDGVNALGAGEDLLIVEDDDIRATIMADDDPRLPTAAAA